MSNVSKTISYLKRNGMKNTCREVLERMDWKNQEEIQKKAAVYEGNRYFADETIEKQQSKAECLKSESFRKNPVFSILVPAYETNQKHLREMMDSVLAQGAFARVELIIADAGSTEGVELIVKEYQSRLKESKEKQGDGSEKKYCAEEQNEKRAEAEFPRIRYIRLKENKGISENTNAALEIAEGDYIGLLDHDDVLLFDALYHIRKKLEEGDYDLIYTDEDKGDGELKHFFEPHFKPDFNLDYLLSNNYICHFLVMKAELMKKLKFRKEYDGAQDYDLVLRAAGEILKETEGRKKIAHIPKVLYHWRCHENSTASNPESKRYAYEAGKRAVEDFLNTYMEMGKEKVFVRHTLHLGFYKVEYKEPVFQARPEVAAICGRVTKAGKVIDGPKWQIEKSQMTLFKGLKAAYGGYMHRAEMAMQVDAMPEQAVCWNKKYQELFKELEKKGQTLSFQKKQEIAKENGDIFLYLPDFSNVNETMEKRN